MCRVTPTRFPTKAEARRRSGRGCRRLPKPRARGAIRARPPSATAPNANSSGSTLEQAVYNAIHTTPSKSIIAGNYVFISAKYLNINGLIQSGQPVQTVTIDSTVRTYTPFPEQSSYTVTESQADAVNAAKNAYSLYRSGNASAAASAVYSAGLITDDYVLFQIPIASTDNIRAFYHADTNQLEISSARVEGGYMELFGQILSTGNGNLKILDGYGAITVNNNLPYDLIIANIDTGKNAVGKLKIIDYGIHGRNGASVGDGIHARSHQSLGLQEDILFHASWGRA